MSNRFGFSPAQRVLGKNPVFHVELTSDATSHEFCQSEDASYARAAEIRRAARQAFVEVDARQRVSRAVNARARRARTQYDPKPGDLVKVWRSRDKKNKKVPGYVGPCVKPMIQTSHQRCHTPLSAMKGRIRRLPGEIGHT